MQEEIIKKKLFNLINNFSKNLELACKNKISTNDISEERLWWEIYNKIFSILVIVENGIRNKDSLSIQLVGRYTYELFIVCVFIFTNKNKDEQIKKFLEFSQVKSSNRMWTNKTYSQMVQEFPYNYKLGHKEFYRKLSNFAHPTIDSFLINRRGEESENIMISSTSLMALFTLTEIINLSIRESEFLDDDHIKLLDIENIKKDITCIRESNIKMDHIPEKP